LSKPRKSLAQNLIWWSLLLLARFFRLLPHGIALSLGSAVATVVWSLSGRRVREAEARCARALKVDLSEARRIVRLSYVNLGRSLAEALRFPVIKDEIGEIVEAHGLENLDRALALGKGVILLTGHLGNWELAAAYLGIKGYPIKVVGAEQRDDRLTDMLVGLRKGVGVTTIGKGFDLRGAIGCLRRGEILGVLLDQDAKEKGIVAPFLGLPASTPYGPVKLAQRIGSPIVPLFIVRRDSVRRHDLYVLPPLEVTADEDNLEASVARCNDVISEWIARFPEGWLWLYPRWASTVKGE